MTISLSKNGHFAKAGAKVLLFSDMCKFFGKKNAFCSHFF